MHHLSLKYQTVYAIADHVDQLEHCCVLLLLHLYLLWLNFIYAISANCYKQQVSHVLYGS